MGKKHASQYANFGSLLIFLCFSCSETIVNRNELKEQLIPTYELIEDGEKTFILDSESQPRNRCIQLFRNPQNDSTYYSFYNEYNNSIYIFDFESTSFIKKIQLQKEGPDGVYPHRSGYYISSFDSIYFYSMATLHIPADTRSAFPVISVQSPVSIQCCWQS